MIASTTIHLKPRRILKSPRSKYGHGGIPVYEASVDQTIYSYHSLNIKTSLLFGTICAIYKAVEVEDNQAEHIESPLNTADDIYKSGFIQREIWEDWPNKM